MQVFSRIVVVAVAGILPAVFAQTTSECDPTKGCYPQNPGLNAPFSYDFSASGANTKDFTVLGSMNNIKYDSDGMHLPCIRPKDSPSVGTNFYIWFGRVDILMKSAPGAGIVSSLVFQSDIRDEIDLEFVGPQQTQYQTNIFREGNRDVSSPGNSTVSNPASDWHTYTIDWTKDSITWSVDGTVDRTLKRSDVPDLFPRTPTNLRIGSWTAGDKSQPEGTIQWSEGPIDYSKGPFDMVVKSIKITNYNPAASYKYKDGSGTEDSIEMSNQEVATATSTTTAVTASSTSVSTVSATTVTSAKSTATQSTDAVTTTVAKTTATSSVGTATTVQTSTTKATGTSGGAATTTTSGAPKATNAAVPLKAGGVGLSAFALMVAVMAI